MPPKILRIFQNNFICWIYCEDNLTLKYRTSGKNHCLILLERKDEIKIDNNKIIKDLIIVNLI